ncbi:MULTISPECIES: MFS transporter [Corynebacterium]|uniref:MFS transporter n=1 Tax=Corynebacterium hesseae TaxID=2913502 RepID=A0ABU9UI25_9CORY|nr:MFS transporter [Corynebacterium sp. HMSC078A10]OFK61913.1 MFS transporter [Corynebacterium sp. HMSC078A10]PKZ24838.1 MFS transporter [Corynebacterium aurimucosum]
MTQSSSPSQESANARRFVWSNGLQGVGDQLLSGKTVLPWLFSAAGVPGFFTGLLVPLRESGSMLPQAALTPWVVSHPARKRLWVLGSVGQGVCAAIIAAAAVLVRGPLLGLIVCLALAVLAVLRALCSLTGKDVQGRTISKGRRGVVTGRATQLGGAVTLITGGVLAVLGELPRWGLAVLLAIGAATWFLAAAVFRSIEEPVPESSGQKGINRSWWKDTWQLYTQDARFRGFVNVRALLLVSALSTSFIVVLSQNIGSQALSGLGGFVLASGLASLVGGRVSGVLSDKSSRLVMSWAAGAAAIILLAIVACAAWAPTAVSMWALPLGFFLVNLAHAAIRVARKTYVVDMAGEDKRTRYVGAANTMMGVILLVVGGISAVIALAGPSAAILFLACIGLIGAWRARALPEVSHGK